MMRSRNHRVHGCALAFALLGAAATPTLAEPVGFVAGIEGRAEIQAEEETAWVAANVDGAVANGDSLRTESDSALKLVLIDDTILCLDEETTLAIDGLAMSGVATREPSLLRQPKGQLRVRAGEAVEIHTPTVVIGAREGGIRRSRESDSSGRQPANAATFTSRIESLEPEVVTLGCNQGGGLFMALPGKGIRVDVPPGFCRRARADRIGPPIPAPDDSVAVKCPSQRMGPKSIHAMLFGSGDSGLLDDWLTTTPPVSAPGPASPDMPQGPERPEIFGVLPEQDPPPVSGFPTIGGGGPGQQTPGN